MTEYSQKIRINRVAEPKIRIKVKPRVPPLDPEFRNTGTDIEVRVGATGEWETLVPLADITGPDGVDGQIVEIVAGTGINVDNTNPANPVVTVDAVAAEIPFTPAGTIAATNTQAAIAELEGKLGPMFATLALAEAYAPAAGPAYIRTAGYTAAGDRGGALYKKVVSEPSHAGKFSITLSDAVTVVWYEIAETTVNVKQLGAQGDGVADDFAEIQAAVNVGRPVEVPPGEYLLSDAVQMVSNLTIRGAGASSKLVSTGTNKRVLYATGKANIDIEGLFIEGNLTGVGSTGATAAGGDGIAFDDCTDVRVANCIFDNIGRSTSGSISSCIRGIEVVGATIEGNLFLENNGGGVQNTGADIDFSYYCRVLNIIGNRSRSEQDSFVYVAAVGSGDDTDRIVISGNYAERSDASVTRTGIL